MREVFSLSGKVALVTGGSRGIGLAMARALGAAGARVIITARRQPELDAAAAGLNAEGFHACAIQSDIRVETGSKEVVDAALAECGHIDILVNNAGTTWGAPAAEYPREAWAKVIDVNLNGAWRLTQEVARRSMIPRRTGNVIMVASILGLAGARPGSVRAVAYNTAKAAQINLARSLASEWGGFGVRVNALVLGWFPTKMTRDTLAGHGEGLTAQVPLGRLGEPEDLAGPILFLASEASRYVTGHALVVDGGLTCCV